MIWVDRIICENDSPALVKRAKDDKTRQVLIVDDEPMNTFVLGSLLSKQNLFFDKAISGLQALDLVKLRIEEG